MEEAFKALWEFVQTAGPAGIFAVMWWLERIERRQLQIDKDKMAVETLEAMKDNSTVLGALKDVVGGSMRRRG